LDWFIGFKLPETCTCLDGHPEEDLKRMVGFGVDAIITDNPVLALRLLGRSK